MKLKRRLLSEYEDIIVFLAGMKDANFIYLVEDDDYSFPTLYFWNGDEEKIPTVTDFFKFEKAYYNHTLGGSSYSSSYILSKTDKVIRVYLERKLIINYREINYEYNGENVKLKVIYKQ